MVLPLVKGHRERERLFTSFVPCRAFSCPANRSYICSTSIVSTAAQPRTGKQKGIDVASVGNMCLDIILPITQYPVLSGEHQRLTRGARLELGGSMNALISAKRLGARAAPVAYISAEDALPSDALLSHYLRESAERIGLDTTALAPRHGTVLPTCAALFDTNGSHTFLASNELPEENPGISAADAMDTMLQTVSRARSLIVDGYAFDSDRSLVQETVRIALRSNTDTWLDPQATTASFSRTKDPLFKTVIESAHGLSLTVDEALELTNRRDPLDTIDVLAREHCISALTILLKDGPRGCHVAWRSRVDGTFEVCSLPGHAIPKGNYRDTIGAGDSFLGAFLAGSIAHGLSMQESGMLANAMGAATCMRHGAGESGVGTREDVVSVLRGSNLAKKLLKLET